jgi:hypothetical protein
LRRVFVVVYPQLPGIRKKRDSYHYGVHDQFCCPFENDGKGKRFG